MRFTRRAFLQSVLAGAALGVVPIEQAFGASPRPHDFVVRLVERAFGPDGVHKKGGMLLVNDSLPGPLIRAREGETVVVRVHNRMREGTSIHWHGMTLQNQWRMDGVANVTQSPIPPGETFEYKFTAAPAGTHLWHSHTGVQYGDGLFGMLIVDAADDPYRSAYDAEAIVCVNDWFHESGPTVLAGILKRDAMKVPASGMKMPAGGMKMPAGAMKMKPDLGDVPFQSALINGKGRAAGQHTPLQRYDVRKGQRVRFRIANISSTYKFRVTLDGHRMRVIAADGGPTAPLDVDSIVVDVGERCDVIVEMNQPIGNYWLRANTLESGVDHGVRAIVRYQGAAATEPPLGTPQWGTVLDPVALRALDGGPVPAPTVTATHTLGGSMHPYFWTIDRKAFKLPAQPFSVNPHPPEPPTTQIKVSLGQVVRLVINNPTMMGHPFHIHGHHFQVLGVGSGNYSAQPLVTAAPVVKDTVSIPPNGWAVLQWTEDNPGFWFFHCHIEWHVATGMAVVIRSGM